MEVVVSVMISFAKVYEIPNEPNLNPAFMSRVIEYLLVSFDYFELKLVMPTW
jgi:hypothetical protein